LVMQAGSLGETITLFNRDGSPVPVRVAGVVEQPFLDLYRMPQPMIFIPYQCASLANTKLLVIPGKKAAIGEEEIASLLREVDPTARIQIQDYGRQVRTRFAVGWRAMEGLLWLAGLAALTLTFTGLTAYLLQFFSERRNQVAVRCALGARGGNLFVWVSRQAAPGLVAGTAAGAALGILALLLPAEIAPPQSWGFWAGVGSPILVLWAAWAAASSLASHRAATASVIECLREG